MTRPTDRETVAGVLRAAIDASRTHDCGLLLCQCPLCLAVRAWRDAGHPDPDGLPKLHEAFEAMRERVQRVVREQQDRLRHVGPAVDALQVVFDEVQAATLLDRPRGAS